MGRTAITIVVAGMTIFGAASARADEAAQTKDCKAGKPVACEELAELYLNGDGVEKDEPKAMGFLEKACKLKSSRACNNLGTAWSEGKEGAAAVDHVKAKSFYDKSCTLKNGLGCFNLGNVYRLGEGRAIDLKLAFASFKKSCDLDEAKGCTEQAIMFWEGKAVKKDVPTVKLLLEKACKLGSEAGCQNYEKIKNIK